MANPLTIHNIHSEQLWAELERLAHFSDSPYPSVTRVLWTPTDMSARAYLKTLAQEAGLGWREDALGNTFIRLEGTEPHLSAVATGSHNDAIPHSGRFDGTVGVMGGLEALRAILRSGIQPKRSLELILFTAEEPTRFGVGCLGSRAMSGVLSAAQMRELKDAGGVSLEQARQNAGYSAPLEGVQIPHGHYHAFVELHIEQMPSLEELGLPIGLVTAIAAPASLIITLEGEGGHAGARLMPGRRDALLAAAEIALAVEQATLELGGSDTVGTTGILKIHPGAINSIPSQAELGIDIRDTDLERRDRVLNALLEATKTICQRRNTPFKIQMLNSDPPARSSEWVLDAARKVLHDIPHTEMVSRAYHDSLFMARVCDIVMLFIPCFKGYSHRPDEYAKPQDIALGVQVLAQTLLELAQ
jgi:ureidoglycolate amidohydrolase